MRFVDLLPICACAYQELYMLVLISLARPCYYICGVAIGGVQQTRGPQRSCQSSPIRDVGERSRRGLTEAHFRVEKAMSYPQSYPMGNLLAFAKASM